MAGLDYPSRTAMVRNILREYRATDKHTGREWYAEANGKAAELAESTNGRTTWIQAAGVIAALSPQTQWWQNVMLAKQAIDLGAMVQGHTGDAMRKVNRILTVQDVDSQAVAVNAILGGLKVRSFFHNIVTAGGVDGVVTIDRHAWRTVCGAHPLGKRNNVPTERAYQLARDAFIRAAEILQSQGDEITAAQLQAVVWVPRAA